MNTEHLYPFGQLQKKLLRAGISVSPDRALGAAHEFARTNLPEVTHPVFGAALVVGVADTGEVLVVAAADVDGLPAATVRAVVDLRKVQVHRMPVAELSGVAR